MKQRPRTGGNRMHTWRKNVEHMLDKILPPPSARPASLHQAMRYAVLSGGKRLRPLLCIAACKAAGGAPSRALRPAAAIELFHTYTLIHDDLPCMDDDDFRRGKPSVHRKFGPANAVLAGDALQALAFETMARRISPEIDPARLVTELAAAAGSLGVAGGQAADLESIEKKPSCNLLAFIHYHKTAVLFRASARIGALAGNAGPRRLEALTRFGELLGSAFQIADDLSDNTCDAASRGGKPDNRKSAPNFNCLSVYSRKHAERAAMSALDRARRLLACLPPPERARLAWFLDIVTGSIFRKIS